MFATLSYNKRDQEEEVRLVPASVKNYGGRRPARLACIECRAKKVKCTGDKSGCARCMANNIKCIYPASSERGGVHRRRNTNTSAPDGNADSPPIDADPSKRQPRNNKLASRTNTAESSTIKVPKHQSRTSSSKPESAHLNNALPASPHSMEAPPMDPTLSGLAPSAFDPSYVNMYSDYMSTEDNFSFDFDQLNLQFSPGSDFANHTSSSMGMADPDMALYEPTTPSTSWQATNFDLSAFEQMDSPDDSGVAKPRCSCMTSAVHMLEALELQVYQDRDLTTDLVLKTQKTYLANLRAWLACEQCSTPKAMSLIMVLIIDRLSSYLQKGINQSGRKR